MAGSRQRPHGSLVPRQTLGRSGPIERHVHGVSGHGHRAKTLDSAPSRIRVRINPKKHSTCLHSSLSGGLSAREPQGGRGGEGLGPSGGWGAGEGFTGGPVG